ncbi:MAG TPA: DUF4190 domain-containing protein [Acidimicrobiia bacterium]|jgi:hypothetical protein
MAPETRGVYMEASQATTALVLGILGIVLCQILGPFAWSMGNKELQAIDAGRRPVENRGTANAAKILGIVGTVLLILSVVGLIIFFAIFAISGVNYFTDMG